VMAAYLRRDGDERAAAPLRARLRLCCSGLAEHRALRHQHEQQQNVEQTAAPTALAHDRERCRACRTAPETAAHLLLECTARPALNAARAATRACLEAYGVEIMDMAAIAGVSSADCDHPAMVLRATARLLLAARTCFRW